MLNAVKNFMKRMKFLIKDGHDSHYILNETRRKFWLMGGYVTSVSELLLIVLLVYLMSHHGMQAAIALVLYNYRNQVNFISYYIEELFNYTQDFNLSCKRVKDIFDGEDFKKEQFGKGKINKIKGNFEFKNVSFSYKDNKVLKNIRFKVNANETVAFVGKSGVGKTTIFNLLCKMYDNYDGLITIDNKDLRKLDKDSIRGNITIISQDPYIFNLSIKDNLKLVKSDLSDKEMKKACKLACLDDFIESLPDKYDTMIGEGGVNLSGGQKQRLAIARAFIQNTEIILFDEATSALDNETQKSIAKAINNMQNKYTILIIAHRLSTIKDANRILFIENGRVKMEGTHTYLLHNCPAYKKLYDSEIEK